MILLHRVIYRSFTDIQTETTVPRAVQPCYNAVTRMLGAVNSTLKYEHATQGGQSLVRYPATKFWRQNRAPHK
jgi:hypothetical protein